MIFDSYNEVLDSLRPYGLKGVPYPWKSNIKYSLSREITDGNMKKVIEKAKEKVLDWAVNMCGYFGEKEDQLNDRTSTINEEYLAQLREDKLATMLATDVMFNIIKNLTLYDKVFEMEERWINYDDEEVEVQVELADLIFDKLVAETVEIITQISEKRKNEKK